MLVLTNNYFYQVSNSPVVASISPNISNVESLDRNSPAKPSTVLVCSVLKEKSYASYHFLGYVCPIVMLFDNLALEIFGHQFLFAKSIYNYMYIYVLCMYWSQNNHRHIQIS